jgi:hypothetical protein
VCAVNERSLIMMYHSFNPVPTSINSVFLIITQLRTIIPAMASDNLPSDFDYTFLFSDLPPTDDGCPPSDVLAELYAAEAEAVHHDPPSESHPDLPSDTFSDDLLALHTVASERRKLLNKKGVVIQHRLHDNKPIFRSSSLPPGKPAVSQPHLLAVRATRKALTRRDTH